MPLVAGPRTGHKMQLYKNVGSDASPLWLQVCGIGDVNVPDLKRAMALIERRCNNFAKNVPSLIDIISVDFRMIHGLSLSVFNGVRQDFFNATPRIYAVMNDDISLAGAEGLKLPAFVEEFPWNQPLKDVSDHTVKVSTAYMEEGGSEIDPSWLVAGGTDTVVTTTTTTT